MVSHQGVALLEREQEKSLVEVGGLARGSVSLRVDFEVSKAQSRPSVSPFLLSVDPSAAPCLSKFCHAPYYGENVLNL